MWQNLTVLILAVLGMAASAGEAAAEMDHSKMDHSTMEPRAVEPATMDHSKMNMDEAVPLDHAKMNMDEAPALHMLTAPPASGKAREAGFDGTELMESTSADAALAVQCAQASRGLIVVDRATWAQCTGKPAMPDTPAAKAPGHQGH